MAKPAAAVVMDGGKKVPSSILLLLLLSSNFTSASVIFGFVWLLLLNRTIVFDLFNS